MADEEMTLVYLAKRYAEELKGGYLEGGPKAVGAIIELLLDALTKPAPLAPAAQSLQVLAERGQVVTFIRSVANNTILDSAATSFHGGPSDEALLAAKGAYEIAERIKRGMHLPDLEKAEEPEGERMVTVPTPVELTGGPVSNAAEAWSMMP